MLQRQGLERSLSEWNGRWLREAGRLLAPMYARFEEILLSAVTRSLFRSGSQEAVTRHSRLRQLQQRSRLRRRISRIQGLPTSQRRLLLFALIWRLNNDTETHLIHYQDHFYDAFPRIYIRGFICSLARPSVGPSVGQLETFSRKSSDLNASYI